MRNVETASFAAINPTRLGSETPPREASGQVQVLRDADRAILTWVLPLTAAVDGSAQTAITLTAGDGTEVPVKLRLLDGPMLELVYGAPPPLANFDNFRCFVSAPDLPRREMGGGSCAEGAFFRSTALGTIWSAPQGPVIFELGL